MHKETQLPIFYDLKGRRWKIVRLVAVLFLLALGGMLYRLIPEVVSNERPVPFKPLDAGQQVSIANLPENQQSPLQLAATINQSNAPVIGQGPLVRVVRIEKRDVGTVGVPVYASSGSSLLTPMELQQIGNHGYAIERYGDTTGRHIALTFDDGPDPIYTPEILNVLSANHAPATFFEIGSEVVKYPAISARIAREGHVIGNHTFDHVNFDFVGPTRGDQEIVQTQRVIRSATGHSTSFLRLPYVGNDAQSFRDNVHGILEAQKLGYVVTSFQFDTDDWQFTEGRKPIFPALNGQPMVVLMHDGGGNRSRTVAYLKELIKEAKNKGYTFVNLQQLYPESSNLFVPIKPTIADRTAFTAAEMYLVWPHRIVGKLFMLTIATFTLTVMLNILLAALQIRRVKYRQSSKSYQPLVSAVVPAYNESPVVAKTVKSILRSRYKRLEVIIVDDGSKDFTWPVAERLAVRSHRVRIIRKRNGGKASALNRGIKLARGEIIIGVDADTVFTPSTISKLVRHFADPSVGAVAGSVKVGNVGNIVSRWQALDYTVGIHVERNAQAFLDAIMIVPGACGAWRKKVIRRLNGYSRMTLAEDFDLTMAVQRAGYKVLQDNEAVAYTEAPLKIRSLVKQRFRWTFGNIQTFWKYRDMMFRRRYGWLGMYVLPVAVFNILMPIVFVPLLIIVNVENILTNNLRTILIFFAITVFIQAVVAVVGVVLARERLSYLFALPFTRFVYGPVRSFLLYRSMLSAIKGAHVGWNKLQRTATVRYKEAVEAEPAAGQAVELVNPK